MTGRELRNRLLRIYSEVEEMIHALEEPGGVDSGDVAEAAPRAVRWRDLFGMHVNPVVAEDGKVRVVRADEIERVARVCSWVVMNFNLDWWESGLRDGMAAAVDACVEHGLNVIVRLEDPSVVRPRGKNKVSPGWWDRVWKPYVESVCRRFKGKVHAYQVMNEVWCLGSEAIWDRGLAPSASEYLEFLGMSRVVIQGMDPRVRVLNAGITTVTEKRYWNYVGPLLDAGWLEESSGINVHLYWDIRDAGEARLNRLAAMTRADQAPLYITEANHTRRTAPPGAKFAVIQGIAEAARRCFGDRLQCVCAFCANRSDHLNGWEILDTPLYDLLKEWVGERIGTGEPFSGTPFKTRSGALRGTHRPGRSAPTPR